MADDPRSRLFRQVLARNSDRVLLERMKMFGFWPQGQDLPPDPPDEADERAALETEIKSLTVSQQGVADPEAALAAERKRRLEESRARREAKKEQRAREAAERREADREHRQRNVVHVGLGHSAGLGEQDSNSERLQAQRLPIVSNGPELAAAMEIELSTLRWLTYHRSNAALVHYHRYELPKKTGGVRLISAPKTKLADAQRWVLDKVLRHLPVEDCAHGFRVGHSIVTNSAPHASHATVVNFDLRDFFPSFGFRRVKGLFRSLGYSEQAATLFALLCTEPPRAPVEFDGQLFHVAIGERVLPQGACTSPAITNLICRKLDRRLSGLASAFRMRYTRYADDLTFSGDPDHPSVSRLKRWVETVVESEGFSLHEGKTRVMRRGRRQTVTGVVVNERPTIQRSQVRRLRAILHNAMKHGLASQNREGRADFYNYLKGHVALVCMVDPKKGAPLRAALRAIDPNS